MALIISIMQPTGQTANYHRISAVVQNYEAGLASVTLKSYASEDAYLQRFSAMNVVAHSITIAQSSTKDSCYQALLLIPQFKEANIIPDQPQEEMILAESDN